MSKPSDRQRLTLRTTPPPAPEPAPTESPATPKALPGQRKRRRVSELTDAEIAARAATLARAREMFPVVFGDEVRPLAIGAGARLREALGVSKAAVDPVMTWWTTRPDYTRAVAAPGSQRWNLDGTVAGDVSAQHRAEAIEKLANPYGKPKAPQQQEGPTVMTATVQASDQSDRRSGGARHCPTQGPQRCQPSRPPS
jgi:sRNA-binding protein